MGRTDSYTILSNLLGLSFGVTHCYNILVRESFFSLLNNTSTTFMVFSVMYIIH